MMTSYHGIQVVSSDIKETPLMLLTFYQMTPLTCDEARSIATEILAIVQDVELNKNMDGAAWPEETIDCKLQSGSDLTVN